VRRAKIFLVRREDLAVSGTKQTNSSFASLYVAGASVVLIPAIALAMRRIGIDSQVAATTSTAAIGFLNLLALQRQQRTKPYIERLRETALGRYGANPLSIAILTAMLIVLTSLAASIVIGGTAILAVRLVAGGIQIPHTLLRAVGTVEVAVSLSAFVPVFVFASHRLPPASSFRWILGSILVATVIRFGLFYAGSRAGYEFHLSTMQWVVAVVLSLLPAWLAHFWARRTHGSFLVAGLVRSLSPEDQQALIDLLAETHRARGHHG
jgi:hypothetical protein